MCFSRAIRLADDIDAELDRITDLRFGCGQLKPLDSHDLLIFELCRSVGIARDEFVFGQEGGDALVCN